MTHTQPSPLPPSSPPALSYIDEDDFQVRKKPQKSTPVASSARPQITRTDDHPPFEFELHHHSKIFSTPRRQPQQAQGSADPFGFLALEHKLKLERTRARRQPLRPLLEPEPRLLPRPGPKSKLGPEPEPERASDPSNYDGAGTAYVPESEIKSTITTLDPFLVTSTPISRHAADITAPPAVTPVHIRRRRRRRPTASASASFLFPVDDDDGNPFLVHSSSSACPTPSPSKDRRERHFRYSDDGRDGDGEAENDENRNPFLIPIANRTDTTTSSIAARGDRTADDASPAVSPIRRKRKRTRAPVDEEGDDKDENMPPKLKTKEERAPLAKKIKTRTGPKAAKVKDDRENENENENENEGKGEGEGGKRRSARLAKRDPLRDDNDSKTRKNIRLPKSKPEPKGKGKENANRKPASRSKQQQKPSKPSSTRVEAKGRERGREGADDVASNWEKERAERAAYFKVLDSYELETENIYVI